MKDFFSPFDLLSEMPAQNAFIYSHRKNYTYLDILNEIPRYTSYLQENDVSCTHAAVISDNNADVIFLLMALWHQGIIPVMINTRLTSDEIKDLIKSSGCGVVFCHKDILKKPEADTKTITFPFNNIPQKTYLTYNTSYEDTAVIIFTSGSTGKAKGVELTFRTLYEAAYLQDRFLKQSKGDKWLVSLPFYHIGGLSILSRSIFLKSSIVIPLSPGKDDFLNSIYDFGPDYISVVSTQLKYMLDSNADPGKGIKKILVGGGFTDTSLITKALNKGWKISRVYGSTETAAFVAAIDETELRKFPDSTGKEIIPGSVFILDENKKPVINIEGEIALKNIPLTKGYLTDSAALSEKIYSQYYITGDIGYINEEGFLFVFMRRSDIVITGGENVNVKEVENVLRQMDGVEDVYVFAEEDVKWGQILSAIVCSDTELSKAGIKDYLQSRIARFKIPKKIYFTDKIPRNELGKVQLENLKKALNIH